MVQEQAVVSSFSAICQCDVVLVPSIETKQRLLVYFYLHDPGADYFTLTSYELSNRGDYRAHQGCHH